MKKPIFWLVLGAFLASTTLGFADKTAINGLFYSWPGSHVAKALKNDGSGNLTWAGNIDTGVASGLIGFFAGACPDGWTSLHSSWAGRYIVGLPSGGTNQGTVGTALTNLEDRSVGQHSHTGSLSSLSYNETNHTHTVNDSGHNHSSSLYVDSLMGDAGAGNYVPTNLNGSVDSNTTGVTLNNSWSGLWLSVNTTINNTGTTASTNAPAIQLLACYKS